LLAGTLAMDNPMSGFAINGTPLEAQDRQTGQDLFNSMKSTSQATITIERPGQRHDVTIYAAGSGTPGPSDPHPNRPNRISISCSDAVCARSSTSRSDCIPAGLASDLSTDPGHAECLGRFTAPLALAD
jgi:hypothetical protein